MSQSALSSKIACFPLAQKGEITKLKQLKSVARKTKQSFTVKRDSVVSNSPIPAAIAILFNIFPAII